MQIYTVIRRNYIVLFILISLIFGFFFLSETGIGEEKIGKQTKIPAIHVDHSGQTSGSGSIDFFADDSYTKFVSPQVTYLKQEYAPIDLVEIVSSGSLQSTKNILLRKEANTALQAMARDFGLHFSGALIVVSGYRSYDYQRGIETRSPECIADGYCARAGHSEHQSGLAIDLFETSNQDTFLSNEKYRLYFDWLKENAHKYGFINSYSQGVAIDGYHKEPWHWRYIGINLATKLSNNGMNFTQYYNASLKD